MLCDEYLKILCVICAIGLVCTQTTSPPASAQTTIATAGAQSTIASGTPDLSTAPASAQTTIVSETPDLSTDSQTSVLPTGTDAVTTAQIITDDTSAPASAAQTSVQATPAETSTPGTASETPAQTTVPELETTGIILTCTHWQMIVEIPKALLTGDMKGENVRFEYASDADNSSCLGEDTQNDYGEDIIELTTNLTACGTNMTESEDSETYTNRVISSYLNPGAISRHYDIDIPLTCSYNRSQLVGSIRYELTDYVIDKTLVKEGEYKFSFDIYTNEKYEEVVGSYPITIGLNEELYFAASVLSLDGTIDLSIRSCRATPNSKYDNSVFFEFIHEGCSTDGYDTNITYLSDHRIGVEMNTFRFIDQDDWVYIHCNLLVCNWKDESSTCNLDCARNSSMTPERMRRDTNSELKTKRFTRGPLRILRSAEMEDGISRVDISENGAATQQEIINAFNPWIVAIAVMVTVVMAMAAMMAVVLRKVSKISAAPRRGHYKEESVPLLDESEEI